MYICETVRKHRSQNWVQRKDSKNTHSAGNFTPNKMREEALQYSLRGV